MDAENRAKGAHALRFAGKVLLIIVACLLILWLIGAAFRISKPLGYSALAVLAIALAATAHAWISALPGLLIFGVFNSVTALFTHRALNNPRSPVSSELALATLAFFAVGTYVAAQYDRKVTLLDRCAFVTYIAAPFWAAFADGLNDGQLRSATAWPMVIGAVAILVAYVVRIRRVTPRIA